MNSRFQSPLVGKKVVSMSIGILGGLLFLVVIDRLLGNYLNRAGYFKAMMPDVTEVYDTSEFYFVATVSAQGLRNPIVAMSKPKGVTRILVLGDSYTFGWGTGEDQTWVRQIEESLKEQGKSVELINAGLPGADLTEKRYICQAYRDRFDVDAVILGVYFDDYYQGVARQIGQSGLMLLIENEFPTLSRLKHQVIGDYQFEGIKPGDVVDVSASWKRTVTQNLTKYQYTISKLIPKVRSDFLNGKINIGLVDRAIDNPDFMTFLLRPDQVKLAMQTVDTSMKRFKEECSKSLPVLIAFIPDVNMVSEKYATYSSQLGIQTDPTLMNLDLDTALSRLASSYGFVYTSAVGDFRADGCENCYYNYDQHLTPLGNSSVAKSVLPSVRALVESLHNPQ